MNNKILKITLILTKDGFSWHETEWDCEIKNLIYKLTRVFDGKIIEKRIKKEDLFVISNKYNSSCSLIEYNIFTVSERKQEAKTLLMDAVKQTAFKFKNEIDTLISNIK